MGRKLPKTKRWPTGIRPWGDGIQIRLWKNGGEVYSETLDGDPFDTSDLAAALKRRDELNSRLKLGLPLFEEDDSPVYRYFRDVAQDYMNTLEADYSTHLSYEGIINKYWMPAYADWLAGDIKTRHIKRELANYPDITSKTKKNILIPLLGIFKHAADDGLITSNPASMIKLKKHQRPKIERFTPEEREAILAQLTGQPLVYFSLLFGTGMRPGELIALNWTDYNGETLHVARSTVRGRQKDSTKNHTVRDVYVPLWVRPVLNAHSTRFNHDRIFVNKDGKPYLETRRFNEAWRAVFETSEIKRIAKIRYRIPYTCRHSRAAELLSTGVDPGDAAKQLGHTLAMFYQTYSEWIEAYSGKQDLSRFDGVGTGKECAKGSKPVVNRSGK